MTDKEIHISLSVWLNTNLMTLRGSISWGPVAADMPKFDLDGISISIEVVHIRDHANAVSEVEGVSFSWGSDTLAPVHAPAPRTVLSCHLTVVLDNLAFCPLSRDLWHSGQ
jgi:hypothetical protein